MTIIIVSGGAQGLIFCHHIHGHNVPIHHRKRVRKREREKGRERERGKGRKREERKVIIYRKETVKI